MPWGLFWNTEKNDLEIFQCTGYLKLIEKIRDARSYPLVAEFSDFENYLNTKTGVEIDPITSIDKAVVELMQYKINRNEHGYSRLAKALFYIMADRPTVLQEMIELLIHGWKPDGR